MTTVRACELDVTSRAEIIAAAIVRTIVTKRPTRDCGVAALAMMRMSAAV
jgi:hypothetical protein